MRAWFSLTLFLSAALLFLVQPMVARMILPLLGGTTAVWNTCMVFFQAGLLLGYAYAHAAPEWLGVRRHAAIHVGILLLPFLVLPIRVAGLSPPAEGSPIPWLLGLLLVAVGIPFFVLATSAPLLQKWFAQTGHHERGDPYFLYGASNLGSLVGLLGYPLLLEPRLTLAHQSLVWTIGYGALVGLTLVCAVLVIRSRSVKHGDGIEVGRLPASPAIAASSAPAKTIVNDPGAPGADAPGLGRRLRWLALAFVPSSLMLGVTSAITTDMAAIPLMWVVPLALYLVSFIVVFSRPPAIVHRLMVFLLPVAIITFALAKAFQFRLAILTVIELHLAAFFVVAMVCHGELANDRPSARHLTGFYLWLAAGGVLGGSLNALIAPQVFDRLIEYPLVAVLACVFGPGATPAADALHSGGGRGGVPAPVLAKRNPGPGRPSPPPESRRPGQARLLGWAFFAFLMGLVFVLQSIGGDPRLVLRRERNFYGILRVKLDPVHHLVGLLHGTTVHGIQSRDPERREEPLGYFHHSGPIGQVFAALSGDHAKKRIAVIGLGAGTLASYVGRGQELTFYEIDPAVERIANDSTCFTYLRDCKARGAKVEVVLGDARVRLQRSHDRYGLIVLDAFSSDVIPIHLITREAIGLYLDRLEEHGVLAIHISSQYFRLEPPISALARDAKLAGLFQKYQVDAQQALELGLASSRWVVMARRFEDLGALMADGRWQRIGTDPTGQVWTDDYANVLSSVLWSKEAEIRQPGSRRGVLGR